MGDIDVLTRWFGEKIAVYLCAENILRDKDKLKHPDSYDDSDFFTKGPTQLKTCNDNIFVPVIMVQYIRNMSQPSNIAPTAPP